MRSTRTVHLLGVLIGLLTVCVDGDIYKDVTDASNLDFVHENGSMGLLWLAEILGPGVGVLDVDGDGLLDIWAIQGGPLSRRHGALPSDQVFKNVSRDGQLRFQRITAQARVEAVGYGMGIATGDIDRDGDSDVFLANYGRNEIWLNHGNGEFELLKSGNSFNDMEWSVAGSFVDVNGDGSLDLYVVNYVGFTTELHKECLGIALKPDYCAPTAYEATADRLYINLGNGDFIDESTRANIDSNVGGGLGVVSADFDSDGLTDFYVANDPSPNFLWRNLGGGRFENVAMVTASAVNGDGKSEASMGLDGRDFDQDCDIDLFMTNLTAETNTLLLNSGSGWFIDGTNQAKLGATSYPYTGFGTGWLDVDLDGDLDLFSANGAVSFNANDNGSKRDIPLGQRNQLWLNNGDGRFTEVFDEAIVANEEASRGVAFADLDNDGDLDIVVANNDGPLRVFQNVIETENDWIGLQVEDQGTTATHAKVGVVGQTCVSRMVRTDGSYASAGDPRVVFGLGHVASDPKISVTWADGETRTFGPLAVNQYHVLSR